MSDVAITILLPVSLAAALAYGIGLRRAEPSILRVAVKTVPVAALAAIAAVSGAPVTLAIALTLCALGDALLALDKRGFLPGLAAFLLGHLAYIALFAGVGRGFGVFAEQPLLIVAAVGIAVFALVMFGWLRSSLGALKLPVLLYVVAIAAMAVAVLTLPPAGWLAILGAYLFVASDAVLATELFKLDDNGRAVALTSAFVWAAYYLGQLAILAAFVPLY